MGWLFLAIAWFALSVGVALGLGPVLRNRDKYHEELQRRGN